MTLNDMNPIDKWAMFVSTGLMFLGIVVLGFLELLDGTPHGAAPITNDAGDVIATPLVDPTIRTGLVIAGLVVLLLLGVYRLMVPVTGPEETPTAQTAD